MDTVMNLREKYDLRMKTELETNVFQASSIVQKYNCNLRRLDVQQEQGLMSYLQLVYKQIEIQCGMLTSSTAIFVPFTTQELFQSDKYSVSESASMIYIKYE